LYAQKCFQYIICSSCCQQAGEAELRVSNAAGRLLFSQKKTYPAGRQQETLRLEGVSGVLFAELVTERGSVARKMLAVRN